MESVNALMVPMRLAVLHQARVLVSSVMGAFAWRVQKYVMAQWTVRMPVMSKIAPAL